MKSICQVLILTVLLLGMVSCGDSTSSNSNNGSGGSGSQSEIASMAGAWDFTATSSSFDSQGGQFMIAVEANLSQDNSGNISASGSVTANGPAGNVYQVILAGSALSSVSDVQLDYLGAGSCTNDSGARNMTGTINASNQVTLTYDDGGSKANITGTYDSSAKTFSGTFTISDAGCTDNGVTGNVSGVVANSVAGSYAGSPVGSGNDDVTFSLTAGTGNAFTGSGTDSQNGNFTITGSSVGNGYTVTSTPGGGGSATTFFGYFDPQLGAKGSALSAVNVGANADSCPNGATLAGESCLYAIFAKQ